MHASGVAFYNEKGRAFSEDGHHLSGSFGHRIRVRWGINFFSPSR